MQSLIESATVSKAIVSSAPPVHWLHAIQIAISENDGLLPPPPRCISPKGRLYFLQYFCIPQINISHGTLSVLSNLCNNLFNQICPSRQGVNTATTFVMVKFYSVGMFYNTLVFIQYDKPPITQHTSGGKTSIRKAPEFIIARLFAVSSNRLAGKTRYEEISRNTGFQSFPLEIPPPFIHYKINSSPKWSLSISYLGRSPQAEINFGRSPTPIFAIQPLSLIMGTTECRCFYIVNHRSSRPRHPFTAAACRKVLIPRIPSGCL